MSMNTNAVSCALTAPSQPTPDGAAKGSAPGGRALAVGFDEMATLGMRLEREPGDEIFSRHGRHRRCQGKGQNVTAGGAAGLPGLLEGIKRMASCFRDDDLIPRSSLAATAAEILAILPPSAHIIASKRATLQRIP
jgi:hypothetical protein